MNEPNACKALAPGLCSSSSLQGAFFCLNLFVVLDRLGTSALHRGARKH
jgi:hypothetical protein